MIKGSEDGCNVLKRSAPEVRFGEIVLDVSEARFWTTSALPANRRKTQEHLRLEDLDL